MIPLSPRVLRNYYTYWSEFFDLIFLLSLSFFTFLASSIFHYPLSIFLDKFDFFYWSMLLIFSSSLHSYILIFTRFLFSKSYNLHQNFKHSNAQKTYPWKSFLLAAYPFAQYATLWVCKTKASKRRADALFRYTPGPEKFCSYILFLGSIFSRYPFYIRCFLWSYNVIPGSNVFKNLSQILLCLKGITRCGWLIAE